MATNYGFTALHYASYRGNMRIIQRLVENGADITVQNKRGMNAIHIAVQNDHPNVMVYFIEKHQIDPKEQDGLGSSALHWACYSGAHDCINFLLYRYSMLIDLNVSDKEGFSPLHLAVMSGKNYD